MKGGNVMADSPLIVKSKAFALDVIQVCKELRVAKCEIALINQFLRSGTSIGANIRETFYAHGKDVKTISPYTWKSTVTAEE